MTKIDKKYTSCVLDCPDRCSLEVEVIDDKVHKIYGTDTNPETRGFICKKVADFAKLLYHKERVLYPMRRTGPKGSDQFERISWDEALNLITGKFKTVIDEHGGRSILPYHYGGSNGYMSDDSIDQYFFSKINALYLEKTICAFPATVVAQGMYGKMPGTAFSDYPKAECIIIWGANTKASNIHLTPYLKEAKKNGAFIACVDPFNSFSKKEIDLHLPIYPGTDVVLALGLINYWNEKGILDSSFIEDHTNNSEAILEAAKNWDLRKVSQVTRIDEDKITLLADHYSKSDPALIRCGWGLERNRNGAHSIASILAIPALMGKFGVLGGGYTFSNGGVFNFDAEAALGKFGEFSGTSNMTQLAADLDSNADPLIKFLFVYNSNPVATTPDQNKLIKNLESDDLFTVVHEQVMTDSCLYADIILPATTFLEAADIGGGYGSYVLGKMDPVIEPMGEARSNRWLFSELGKRMGLKDRPFYWSEREFEEKILDSLKFQDANTEGSLDNGDMIKLKFDGGNPIQFKNVFPRTEGSKAELEPVELGEDVYVYKEETESNYPLALISSASSKMISSTFGGYNYKELCTSINPHDAAKRKIGHGDTIKVFNDLGEVICTAIITDKIAKGVVLMPKGAWRRSSKNNKTSTALCSGTVSDIGAACFNDARVEIVLG